MKRWMNSLAVAAAVVAMTSQLTMAQNEGGRGRGGRFGGMGMFGGGLGGLIAMKEVQAELKLSEEDAKKIADKLAEFRPQRGEGGGNFREMSEEERAKLREEGRKRMEELGKKVEETLKANLTEDQMTRLKELRLQREGVASLDRKEIAEDLKLTSEQKEKIKKLVEENRPRFGGGRRGAGGGGEGAAPPSREEFQKRAEKLRTDVLAVLTEEQKSAWEKLKGTEFKFPEPQFGGGQGGGRRNRPAAE